MTLIVHRSFPTSTAEHLKSGGVMPLLARLLASRGVTEVSQLSANLSGLIPPNLLTNNQAMAKLLADAIITNKKLLVIGDYLRSLNNYK